AGFRLSASIGIYISCGKIVPMADATTATTMSQTPTLTEEKKLHTLSTIDLLYVKDRLALPSLRIFNSFDLSLPSICSFSSIGLPQASQRTVPSGLTCPHSHLIFFIYIPLNYLSSFRLNLFEVPFQTF